MGDSPIIGAGLFVDDEVGGACATGWGESVMRVVGAHLVVELMRAGHAPGDACRLATERVLARERAVARPGAPEALQVGFLALAKDGTHGAHAVAPGFSYAVHDAAAGNRLIDAPHPG